MANKNLVINFSHPGASSSTFRYARIDNTDTPSYITVPNVLTSPLIIQNVANGQYRIFAKPNYPDGRACTETEILTDACTGILAFSAIIDTGNFKISYDADPAVPFVKVNIDYPNGGKFSQQYANTGIDITIAPPTGVYGDYQISIQPVCDPDSGWFGADSAPVILNIPTPP